MKVKSEINVGKNYTKIPNEFFEGLTLDEIGLMSYLQHLNTMKFAVSSLANIAAKFSVSKRTLIRIIGSLEKKGFLKKSGERYDTIYCLKIGSDDCKNTGQTGSKKKKKSKKTKEKSNVSDSQPKENSFKLLNTEKNKQHYRPSESTKTTAESYAEANKAKETATEKKIRQLLEGYSIKHATQKPIYTSDSFYIVDFYLPEINLVVEVDGGYHYTVEQIEYDNKKNDKLLSLGYNVLRFSNKDYRKGWDTIREMIKNKNI